MFACRDIKLRVALAFCAALSCAACASLPPNIHREASYALADPENTALGQAFLSDVVVHAGRSGFVPIVAGANAYRLRAAMAGLARHTLDLQYYIWEDDLTGRMMLRDVMKAAERGVRVRLLLDDVHTEGETVVFSRVDRHPMIEVRLFNPFARRDARMIGWLLDGARLNHRMHNKVMVADNAIAVTGGRNIGDHYFAVDELSNFRDLDLLAVGPVVQDLSSMFDLYWNSGWSYPVSVIDPNTYTKADARQLADELHSMLQQREPPFTLDRNADAMRARLASYRNDFSWGRAYTIFDDPAKLEGDHVAGRGVAEVLFDTLDEVERELLIETAYFIPGERGVERLGKLVDRGVDVTVLTNSLATNDVLAAHAGYMDYRKGLLEAGVGLHELRPDAIAVDQHLTALASGSKAALHTKALVYDRHAVFVGSFNLDPRSLVINTEMGVLVESPELARKIADIIRTGLRPENSYRLTLVDGEIRWRLSTATGMTLLASEPETSWWDRFLVNTISLLPINDQL